MRPDHPDGILLDLVRSGDDAAYAELWLRHSAAAHRLARQFRGPWDADDLVAEAYTRVLDLLRRGRGPADAFRPYLFVVIRNLAQAWSKTVTDDLDDLDLLPDPTTQQDPAIRRLESNLTRRAFDALPERQRAVLWYTEVEGMTPAEVSPLLGMTPNSVSALAYRARESLRVEWIQAHLARSAVAGDCEWTLARLGDHTRDRLTTRHTARLEAHLANCAACSRARAELRDVGAALAIAILAPVVGVGAGIGYLAEAGSRAAVAASASSAAVAGAAAGVPATVGATVFASTATLALLVAVAVTMPPPADSAAPASTVIAEHTGDFTGEFTRDFTGEREGSPGQSPVTTDPPAPPELDPPLDPAAVDPVPADPAPPDPVPAVPVPVVTSAVPIDGGRPAFAGTGQPGATVDLARPDGTRLWSAPVDADGAWTLAIPGDLGPLDATGFLITQTDASGRSSDPVALGPYEFRLRPTTPTTGLPCGPIELGIAGWEWAGYSASSVVGDDESTMWGMLDGGGEYRPSFAGFNQPFAITFSYGSGDRNPVVFTGCGWQE